MYYLKITALVRGKGSVYWHSEFVMAASALAAFQQAAVIVADLDKRMDTEHKHGLVIRPVHKDEYDAGVGRLGAFELV